MFKSGPLSGRLLVIDDDPVILRTLKKQLNYLGYMVDTAGSGNYALPMIHQTTYDAVLSDIRMPEGDGLSVLRNVREWNLDVPVIFLTGDPDLDSAISAVKYGAFQYITKPYKSDELCYAVERAIKMYRLARLKNEALRLIEGDKNWLGDKASLEARFQMAMDTMWLAFQPIVDLGTQSTFGIEALLRSQEKTLSNPLDFLEVATHLGRMSDLGDAIRQYIADRLSQIPSDIFVFVNLHTSDLASNSLYAKKTKLAESANRIVFEITERTSINQIEDLGLRIIQLRELGFHVAVDDLGAGHAGLASFTQIEPDFAKIDLALVHDVDKHPVRQRVIQSIVKLCQQLDIKVIAEGVERQEESDLLTQLGCDFQQGYLFAKPNRQFILPVW